MPGHYILEGLLVTQYAGDQTPIQASIGSPFWTYLGCDDKVEDGQAECFGSAENWVYATFDGIFVVEHIPGDIAYLVGLLVFTRVVTLLGLQFLNYRKT